MKQLIRYLLQLIKFPKARFKCSSVITFDCILGNETSIGFNSKLISSNVGNNFKIADHVICSKLFAGNNVAISSNTVVVNGSLGRYVGIGSHVVMFNSEVGNHSYLAQEVLMFNSQIGNYSSIGPRVIFGHGDHPVNRISSSPEFYSKGSSTGHYYEEDLNFQEFPKIKIGNDVWIGANAYIKHGITIGDGAIIGSGAVITKDVEPYSIVGGVPAKLIKKRFSDKLIKELLLSQWWKWNEEQIKKRKKLFQKEIDDNILDNLF